jgi:hypothetical protein
MASVQELREKSLSQCQEFKKNDKNMQALPKLATAALRMFSMADYARAHGE